MKINERYQINKPPETERFAEAVELTIDTLGRYFAAAWVIGYTFDARAKFAFRVWASEEARDIMDEHKSFIFEFCQEKTVGDQRLDLKGLGIGQEVRTTSNLNWDELFEKVRDTFCALLIVGISKGNEGEIRGFSVDEASHDALIIPRMYFEDWMEKQD